MDNKKKAKELENNGREFVRMRFKSELENLFFPLIRYLSRELLGRRRGDDLPSTDNKLFKTQNKQVR